MLTSYLDRIKLKSTRIIIDDSRSQTGIIVLYMDRFNCGYSMLKQITIWAVILTRTAAMYLQ